MSPRPQLEDEFAARLRMMTLKAYATIPHDVRGALTVRKADDDQAHAERMADGEEETS